MKISARHALTGEVYRYTSIFVRPEKSLGAGLRDQGKSELAVVKRKKEYSTFGADS